MLQIHQWIVILSHVLERACRAQLFKFWSKVMLVACSGRGAGAVRGGDRGWLHAKSLRSLKELVEGAVREQVTRGLSLIHI